MGGLAISQTGNSEKKKTKGEKRAEREAAAIKAAENSALNSASTALPIDAYQEEILYRIRRDRVTIIHGETGCGKSSRVPSMLLEDSKKRGERCKMMISQPRRIAASSLMKRLRETLGDEVGMRMGHGVKDETSNTKLFFVTTGYLVRLLAYHPGFFDSHSHLVIDEVHERSVDGDVLCYLAKRLLSRHPTLKLVLMSATMHISLYQDYFASDDSADSIYYGDLECLSVGVRRFPLQIYHADELCKGGSKLPTVFKPLCKKLCEKKDNKVDPEFAKKQYKLAFNIILEAVQLGTGVLVFVSGIQDITEINELFVTLDNEKYVVVHIHSDIPYEEQELAFKPVRADQIKVILATNAAESSITLPDVDVVICLGTHKAIAYDAVGHHVMLANQFISKASAAQRAGRTGRTRPGTVYRLYSSDMYNKFSEHDTPEVLRMPLEDVILNLRAMLEESNDFEGVVPILESLLEAPETSNIENSFQQLHKCRMLTSPGDDGELTPLGRMSGNLPVDLHMSRMIAFGIALGIGAEAVAMAAALTIPKSPFRTAHNLIHTDPDEFNDIIQKSFLAAVRADAGMYSHPLMLVRLLCSWRAVTQNGKGQHREQCIYNWLRVNNVVRSRIQQLDSTAKNIARTVGAVLQRIDRRIEARRVPKYDLTAWLDMQDENDLGSEDGSDLDGFSDSSSLPFLPDDDYSCDEDDNEIAHENEQSMELDNISLKVNLENATEEERVEAASRLNMCRLILAWSSDEMVLKQNLKKKLTVDAMSTVRLGNTELSVDQCMSLFPRDVPYDLRSTGSFIFDCLIRPDLTLTDVLANMCSVGQFMADVRYDSSVYSKEGWRDKSSIDCAPPVIWIAVKETNVLFIAIADPRLEKEIFQAFYKGTLQEIDMEFGCYHVFGVSKVSKKELKRLVEYRNSGVFERVLAMTVPVGGHSSLTVTGTMPCYEDIQQIFCTSDLGMHEPDHHESNLPAGVSLQIKDRSQILAFELENENIGRPYVFKDSLINDIPIGMRMYSTYKAARFKDKVVMVKKYPNLSNQDRRGVADSTASTLVPGSVEWNAIKSASAHTKSVEAGYGGQSNEGGGKSASDDVTLLSGTSPNSAWNSKKLKGNGKLAVKSIFLPSASPISVAIHTGDEPVFGCAFSALDLYPGDKQKCDGISLFPVGYKWITLAYDCMGYNTLPIYDGSMKSPPKPHDRVTARDRRLIRVAKQLLSEQEELGPVGFNSKLTEAVQFLFAPWVEAHVGVYVDDEEELNAEDQFCANEAVAVATSLNDFDKNIDYTSLLYKGVRDIFGIAAAETISYSPPRKDGAQFVTEVRFTHDGKQYGNFGFDAKKKFAKRNAAYLCVSELCDGPPAAPKAGGTVKSSRDKGAPFNQSIVYKERLSNAVKEKFGTAAWQSMNYVITPRKKKVDGQLTFFLFDGDNKKQFNYKVKAVNNKKHAINLLAYECLNSWELVKM